MNDFFCPNAKSPDGRLYLKWKLAQTDSRSSPVLPWWFPWEWGSSHPPSLCTLYSNLDQGWAGRPSPGTLGSQPAVTEICKYQCLNLSVVAGNLFKKTKKKKHTSCGSFGLTSVAFSFSTCPTTVRTSLHSSHGTDFWNQSIECVNKKLLKKCFK